MRPVTPIAERLWAKVERREPDDCWLWLGGTIAKGYGQMGAGRAGDGTKLVHRVAWEAANGPIPAGAHVLHQCDNPPCCNPAHLFLGTNGDNVADMYRKGRGNTGARNGLAKLDAAKVRTIRLRRAEGETLRALADEFGITIATVCDLAKRRTWRHVA